MRDGELLEIGSAEDIYFDAGHDYPGATVILSRLNRWTRRLERPERQVAPDVALGQEVVNKR